MRLHSILAGAAAAALVATVGPAAAQDTAPPPDSAPRAERPGTAAPRAVGDASGDAQRTLDAIDSSLGAIEVQLRRLERDDSAGVSPDSLAEIEQAVGDLRRRLRAAQAAPARRAGDAGGQGLPGLRVAAVAGELAPYFGAESEGGLLVLQADESWAPIRTGDVILRVNGEPADSAALSATRMRDTFDRQRRSRVELLRRQRLMAVSLQPHS